MLHMASYDIVFQEIPGEVTLALNISGCPNRCPGCHSPHLQEDIGEELTDDLLRGILQCYGASVTLVCFMGGDAAPNEVERLSAFIRHTTGEKLKTGWYSGKTELPPDLNIGLFNYIKLGPYIEQLGGLNSDKTNQRLYKIQGVDLIDITRAFTTIGEGVR